MFDWASAGTSLGAAALGYFGQRETNAANVAAVNAANAANLEAVRLTNETNREISNAQMEFQRNMSNTAHQREMEDLKRAGLNPILAVTKGAGASTPTGAGIPAQAGRVDAARVENAFGKSMSTAVEAAQMASMIADVYNKIETNDLIRAQKGTEAERARNISADTDLKTIGVGEKDENINYLRNLSKKIGADIAALSVLS